MSIRKYLSLFSLLFAIACTEPYDPPGSNKAVDFLVVDGFINASAQVVSVKLSKAILLSATTHSPAVKFASVSIADEANSEFILTEQNPQSIDSGLYIASEIPIQLENKYKLKVTLPGGKKYESDFVTVEQTAAIKDIVWKPEEDGLSIQLNTISSEGKSIYYRWKYSETFQYNSLYFSAYLLEPNREVRLREPDEFINECYRTNLSSGIDLASSEDLTMNVIYNHELTKIDRGSIKLSMLYSINVQQQALSEEAHNYWLNLFKSSEQLGGLFDPMPYQLVGNIHAVDGNNEVVIGYFSASTVEEKRIFIKPEELPERYSTFVPPYCLLDTVFVEDLPNISPFRLLIDKLTQDAEVIGYTSSEQVCIDCRLNQGSTTKPEFWP
jgi:hypothetical protein